MNNFSNRKASITTWCNTVKSLTMGGGDCKRSDLPLGMNSPNVEEMQLATVYFNEVSKLRLPSYYSLTMEF